MTHSPRAILFAATALLVAAVPALAAASAAPTPTPPAFLLAAPAAGCAAAPALATPAALPAPAAASGLDAVLAGKTQFRGYCKCSCSFVKNCNTSADCGGAACIAGITCC